MPARPVEKLLTGIPEFDRVLRGGLAKGRVHLLEGSPGTGKTTIAMQFLLEGVKRTSIQPRSNSGRPSGSPMLGSRC